MKAESDWRRRRGSQCCSVSGHPGLLPAQGNEQSPSLELSECSRGRYVGLALSSR